MEGVHSINLSELGGLGLECWLLNCPEKLILVDVGMRDPSIEKIEEEDDLLIVHINLDDLKIFQFFFLSSILLQLKKFT